MTFDAERIDGKVTHKFIFKQDVYLDSSLICWQINRSVWLIENARQLEMHTLNSCTHFKVGIRRYDHGQNINSDNWILSSIVACFGQRKTCRWRVTIGVDTVNYDICQVNALEAWHTVSAWSSHQRKDWNKRAVCFSHVDMRCYIYLESSVAFFLSHWIHSRTFKARKRTNVWICITKIGFLWIYVRVVHTTQTTKLTW